MARKKKELTNIEEIESFDSDIINLESFANEEEIEDDSNETAVSDVASVETPDDNVNDHVAFEEIHKEFKHTVNENTSGVVHYATKLINDGYMVKDVCSRLTDLYGINKELTVEWFNTYYNKPEEFISMLNQLNMFHGN